jgi:hypothetical protein
MLSSIDHYTVLLRAVARLDRNSYEARGAIYDRALTALVRRLTLTVPPYSEADVDRELLAFREAVRRVEFGELDEKDRLAQRAMVDREARNRRDLRQDLDQALHNTRPSPQRGARRPARQRTVDEPPPLWSEPMPGAAEPSPTKLLRRRGVLTRVARRAVLAALLVAVGIAGYYGASQVDFAALAGLLERMAGWRIGATADLAEPAIYYEQADSGAPWRELAGKARWQTRVEEPSGGSSKPAVALTLDVQIPGRGLSLAMSIRRDASADAVITHLVELKFSDAQGEPLTGVTSVSNIVMKQANGNGSSALAGRSVKVAPGLFLFGLSAEKADAPRNAEALRTLPRLDIPFAYDNGATGVISVNKRASGDRAFGAALANWAR